MDYVTDVPGDIWRSEICRHLTPDAALLRNAYPGDFTHPATIEHRDRSVALWLLRQTSKTVARLLPATPAPPLAHVLEYYLAYGHVRSFLEVLFSPADAACIEESHARKQLVPDQFYPSRGTYAAAVAVFKQQFDLMIFALGRSGMSIDACNDLVRVFRVFRPLHSQGTESLQYFVAFGRVAGGHYADWWRHVAVPERIFSVVRHLFCDDNVAPIAAYLDSVGDVQTVAFARALFDSYDIVLGPRCTAYLIAHMSVCKALASPAVIAAVVNAYSVDQFATIIRCFVRPGFAVNIVSALTRSPFTPIMSAFVKQMQLHLWLGQTLAEASNDAWRRFLLAWAGYSGRLDLLERDFGITGTLDDIRSHHVWRNGTDYKPWNRGASSHALPSLDAAGVATLTQVIGPSAQYLTDVVPGGERGYAFSLDLTLEECRRLLCDAFDPIPMFWRRYHPITRLPRTDPGFDELAIDIAALHMDMIRALDLKQTGRVVRIFLLNASALFERGGQALLDRFFDRIVSCDYDVMLNVLGYRTMEFFVATLRHGDEPPKSRVTTDVVLVCLRRLHRDGRLLAKPLYSCYHTLQTEFATFPSARAIIAFFDSVVPTWSMLGDALIDKANKNYPKK